MNKREQKQAARERDRAVRRVYLGGGQVAHEVARGCSGKFVYHSLGAAKDWARWTSRKVGHRLKPYRCRFCDRFHLTHAKPANGSADGG